MSELAVRIENKERVSLDNDGKPSCLLSSFLATMPCQVGILMACFAYLNQCDRGKEIPIQSLNFFPENYCSDFSSLPKVTSHHLALYSLCLACNAFLQRFLQPRLWERDLIFAKGSKIEALSVKIKQGKLGSSQRTARAFFM